MRWLPRFLFVKAEVPTTVVPPPSADDSPPEAVSSDDTPPKTARRSDRRTRLATLQAAIEKDLLYLDEEDLPAYAERDDNTAVIAKAQVIAWRGHMLARLTRVGHALHRCDATETTARLRTTPAVLVGMLDGEGS